MGDGPDIIHIAGPDIQVGHRLRQRCSWCGAVIDDHDLTVVRAMVPDDGVPDDGSEGRIMPMWPVGELIAVAGWTKWVTHHNDGDVLPAECCAYLPHEVTGHTQEAGSDG